MRSEHSPSAAVRPVRGAGSALPGGAPLGRGSLTWRLLGDSRNVLVAQRAGLLQVMHPAIAAALRDHSDVFANPIGRLVRSAGPILGVVYDEDPHQTARWVRDQHPRIRGRDHRGRPYHALAPDVYYWAHATFFEGQIAAQTLFGRPLTRGEREQLYDESITWYSRYGLSMRPVPPDYDAFCAYWDRMIGEVLESTSLARAGVRYGGRMAPPHRLLRGVPWRVLEPPATRAIPWLVRATLPPLAREKLNVSWGPRDEAAFTALRTAVRLAWRATPRRFRLLPRAAAAEARA